MKSESTEITHILKELGAGKSGAEEELFRHVYQKLRRLAANQLRKERRDHTLQPTALVHEAYVRLLGGRTVDWENRSHFFAAAAHAMRHILVDHARKSSAAKRDGIKTSLEVNEIAAAAGPRAEEILAVHEALERLEAKSPRLRTVVEMRFFAGFAEEEIADILNVSVRTVKRDWQLARTWLLGEIRGSARS